MTSELTIGRLADVARGEAEVWAGRHPDEPFVLVAQQSLIDPARVPQPGMHTLWAYCHVPNGSTVDMTERIEAQIERFAPGFHVDDRGLDPKSWCRFPILNGGFQKELAELREYVKMLAP